MRCITGSISDVCSLFKRASQMLVRISMVVGLLTYGAFAQEEINGTVVWTITQDAAQGWSGVNTLTVTNNNYIYSGLVTTISEQFGVFCTVNGTESSQGFQYCQPISSFAKEPFLGPSSCLTRTCGGETHSEKHLPKAFWRISTTGQAKKESDA
jgi:hypothetical protein